ncbi:probable E3 ubiquitin-protein ligase ARI5 [Panicum virgatum]|uniref:RBR-type E3 ubiquitin transferase n=1 Tax=Panicum virgatum TaxID=38727 RepID=A0A8T0PSD3_PANVG|nr:probable E3 ubiquitin-protein ligase ARI5 [Panicum virgatum]XP_039777919.1 probable E3 ubiquitin-protein ligase ARI5 [Panicum virgatum]KAG2564005.1 hypothetical protein PVAP13_8KG380000 [Panicum virgatum]
MAPGDGEESDRYKRGRRAGGCEDGDGEDGPDKRCRIAGADGESGDDGTGDYSISGDEADGDCAGEDLIYYYSDDDEEAEVGASAIQRDERRYVVLGEDDLHDRQAKDTAEVAEVLSVPPGVAAALLRHFRWEKTRLKEEWFSDDRRIRDAVGLPAADGGAPAPMALSRRELVCSICFGTFSAGETRSAACAAHFYCDECWRGYIRAAVEDGPRCLSLRCPDPACSAAVVRELVDAVAGGADRARYTQFALRSYVDERRGAGGGGIRWCPGRGCARAVEFLGCAGAGDATDVFCDCRHGFCWACGEEAHRPVSCATVRAWLAKNSADSASANWVLANTKACPKCRRPIEKNQGCNNMTCRAPCGHKFCWICLEPLGRGHTTCDAYRPRRPDKAIAGAGKGVPPAEELRREQARASLDRYLYHYEHWAANQRSLEQVLRDMAALERSELWKMAGTVRASAADLGFLTRAYEQVAGCRRVLRWAYAYGYFLDPVRDAAKRGLFDHLQGDANRSLERLHGCAEGERKELCAAAMGASPAEIAERYRRYKKKLENLTEVTRRYFENLVKAFETDLGEVKPAK